MALKAVACCHIMQVQPVHVDVLAARWHRADRNLQLRCHGGEFVSGCFVFVSDTQDLEKFELNFH